MPDSIPIITHVCHLFYNEDAAYQFLIDNGFLGDPCLLPCPECQRRSVKRDRSHSLASYRCSREGCRKSFSNFENSIFYRSKLPLNMYLQVIYFFAVGLNVSKIEQLTGIPHKTVCHAVGILKEVLTVDLELLPAIQQQIGGEGIIVEIDESKFGKKRTIYGHPVHGVWVFGGVERTAERKMFLTPVDNRSAATLMPIIERYVQPGSIIYTDCWPAYRDQELHELGMEHFRVNHSQNFVDPNTGCHTQHIEGNWRGIKIAVPTRDERKELIKGSLLAFIWRRKFKDDLWWNLLRAVCSISFEHGVADEPQLIALGEAE